MDVFVSHPQKTPYSGIRFAAEPRRVKPSERRRDRSSSAENRDTFVSSSVSSRAKTSRTRQPSPDDAFAFDVRGLSRALTESTQLAVPLLPSNEEWFDAVERSDVSRLKEWLRLGERPDREDARHETALFKAIRQNNPDLIKLLLHYKANLLHPDETGRTPLHLIASEGNRELLGVVRPFIKPSERSRLWNVTDEEGVTPLMLVNQPVLASRLEIMGANPHAIDRQGCLGLHHAALAGNTEMMAWYKRREVNINSPDTVRGLTSLHLAIFAKQGKAVRWLLDDADVDVNRCDMEGQTPSGYALLLNSDESIRKRLLGHPRLNQVSVLECLSIAAYMHDEPLIRDLLKKIRNFPRAVETVLLKSDDVNQRHMALETLQRVARQENHRELRALTRPLQETTQERLALAASLGDVALAQTLFRQVDNFPRVIRIIDEEVSYQDRRNTAFNTLLIVAKREKNRSAQILLRDIGKRPTSSTQLSGHWESARRFSTGDPFNKDWT